jgi:hypothetical protein
MPQTISPLDILNSHGKHPEREKSDECTSEVRIKAADLAERVSRLVDHLGIKPIISSGFRTTEANRKAGGSRSSAHLSGEAVDLEDKDGKIAILINARPDLLATYDLYMENTNYTSKWVHLQTRPTLSGRRIFVP